MTNPSTLDPDERRLVSYFASRVVMSFGEAQELRSSIAVRYGFHDARLTYFSHELLRRSGLSKPSQPSINEPGQELSEGQLEFLSCAVEYLSPGFDLGTPKPIQQALRSELSPQNTRNSIDLKSLTHCYSCKSAEGKPKKIYRSRIAAEHAAHEAGRVFRKSYGSYGCVVQTNWWHLRTVKPTAPTTENVAPPCAPDLATEHGEAPSLPKVHIWTPDTNSVTYELNLRTVAARASL